MSNISISPSKLEIELKTGVNYVQSYIVKNNGTDTISLTTSVDSWVPQGPDGDIEYLNSSPNLNISMSNTDLKLGESFILRPSESRQLVLKINSDSPGEHYLTFFVTQNNLSAGSSNTSQLIKVGSHLLITSTNTENQKAILSVSNFKTKNYFIDSLFTPIKFTGEIHNQSNFFDKINGTIKITKNNSTIKTLTLFPDNVLANHSRSIRCLENNLPVTCQINQPFWPGIYQASTLDKTITFIVFPYSIALFIAILFILIKTVIDFRKAHKL